MRAPEGWFRLAATGTLVFAAACRPDPPPSSATTAVYSRSTGRLEQLVVDRDGDGRSEARAFMDGTALLRIELDRNADGQPDRWEYYEPAPPSTGPANEGPVIARVEETNGRSATVTRHEFYEAGTLARVEDDTDLDGRFDKWETYVEGVLTRVDLDLTGRGQADRRLIYDPSGNVIRVEGDPDSDGHFEPIETIETGGSSP
jgi:hypothetical protein